VDVRVGDELPPFTREAGFHAWNRFAAVNEEFVDIHMDDEAGRAAGFRSAFGMGALQWSYLHCLLRQWLGTSGGRIVHVQCQFRGASEKGGTVTARGVVTAVRDERDGRFVDAEVWTETEDGTKLAPGTATVCFGVEPSGPSTTL
jgi:acyl dehydratase